MENPNMKDENLLFQSNILFWKIHKILKLNWNDRRDNKAYYREDWFKSCIHIMCARLQIYCTFILGNDTDINCIILQICTTSVLYSQAFKLIDLCLVIF